MSVLSLHNVHVPPLHGITLRLGVGVHVVLGSPESGTNALIEACSGLIRLSRGKLRLNGKDPRRTPKLRAQIGSLLRHEPHQEARTVVAEVASALSLKGSTQPPERVLGEAGLEHYALRSVVSLNPSEIRSVALALALTGEAPALLCLYEPLAYHTVSLLDWIVHRIKLLGQATCVLCTTASARQAAALADHCYVLEKGGLVRRPTTDLGDLTPGASVTYSVHVADPRKLCAVLSADAFVSGVEWSQDRGRVLVQGPDSRQTSLSILRAVSATGTTLHRLCVHYPALEEVEGASEGLTKAARDAAYGAAQRAHAAAWARSVAAGHGP